MKYYILYDVIWIWMHFYMMLFDFIWFEYDLLWCYLNSSAFNMLFELKLNFYEINAVSTLVYMFCQSDFGSFSIWASNTRKNWH